MAFYYMHTKPDNKQCVGSVLIYATDEEFFQYNNAKIMFTKFIVSEQIKNVRKIIFNEIN